MALLKDETEIPCSWATEMELGTIVGLVAG
jgi:hypothetical protein